MLGDLHNWEDDRWKKMKANAKGLGKSCQCCYAERGRWRSFVKVMAWWVTVGRQWANGRGGTANSQANNIILFKLSQKSFSMSSPKKARWMSHFLQRIEPQPRSRKIIHTESYKEMRGPHPILIHKYTQRISALKLQLWRFNADFLVLSASISTSFCTQSLMFRSQPTLQVYFSVTLFSYPVVGYFSQSRCFM